MWLQEWPYRCALSQSRKFVMRAKTCIIIALFVFLALGKSAVEKSQEGPALRINNEIRVGDYRLGEPKVVDSSSKEGRHPDFVDGKCISACSDSLVSNGIVSLHSGFISSKTLALRLGSPAGTTHVAGSTVWIYDIPLRDQLSNGKSLTRKGFLYVFFDDYLLFCYLNHFELTIEGSGMERWDSG